MGTAYSRHVPPPLHRRRKYEALPKQNGPPCSPYQPGFQSIRLVKFVASNEDGNLAKRYKRLIKKLQKRLLKIGPGSYYGRPITGRHNPSNPKTRTEKSKDEDPKTGYSYVILELSYPPSKFVVQLLIREYDLYLVAFRRQKDNVWSDWFRCMDQFIPSYFKAESMGISGQHNFFSTIGGTTCLDDMFFGFATYPEHKKDKASLRRALLRAVVIFCEALRCAPLFREIFRRFKWDAEVTDLGSVLWSWIRCWGNLSQFALMTGKNGGVVDKADFASYCIRRNIRSFSQLIGKKRSVLSVLMRHEATLLGDKIPEGLQGMTRPGQDVIDPPFEDDDDAPVEEGVDSEEEDDQMLPAPHPDSEEEDDCVHLPGGDNTDEEDNDGSLPALDE